MWVHDTNLCRNQAPQESYSDGRHAGYFMRVVRTLLRSPGYYEAPLYIVTPTLPCSSTYVWNVCVVLYKKATTDHICRTHQVHEVADPRATLRAGIRDAARGGLTVLHHEEDETMDDHIAIIARDYETLAGKKVALSLLALVIFLQVGRRTQKLRMKWRNRAPPCLYLNMA
jgi:hypothetical protein